MLKCLLKDAMASVVLDLEQWFPTSRLSLPFRGSPTSKARFRGQASFPLTFSATFISRHAGS